MEFGSWQENRNGNFDYLQRGGELTDVNILVDGHTYPAHRVVLAAHSEYFHRMFTCGMAESRNQDIKLQDIEVDVFEVVLSYIYCGRIESKDVEILKGLYMAANMLQMSDLEHLAVTGLVKVCSLSNCLDLYFFASTFCDTQLHAQIFKKVRRVLSELLSEHWGEMIGQTHSAAVSSRYTQLFQDGILPIHPDIMENKLTTEMEKLQQDYLQLDFPSLCEIFRLKSDQEEVGDFSFSFVQTDLGEGLVAWINYDLEGRQLHIHSLRQYVCLHQVSGTTKRKFCKLLHKITSHNVLYYEDDDGDEDEEGCHRETGGRCITYGQLEQDCIGLWCPNRRIPGLLLIHAWNPNDMNTLTSDHVKCHFVRPTTMLEGGGGVGGGGGGGTPLLSPEVLEADLLYSVREVGELSEGETHWLTNNNPLMLPNGSTIVLTIDCGVVCGQVYHGLDTTAKCPHHSNRFPDFCMSSIREDMFDLKSGAVCSAETGHVYIVTRKIDDGTSPDEDESEGTCDTFRPISPPSMNSVLYNCNSACLKGNLYLFGGTSVSEGPDFGYIWCSFDLQEFHTRHSQSYRAGHSIWRTKLTSIGEEPVTSLNLYIHDLNTGAWMTYPDETPFRISGGATVWHLGKLYLIGGYQIDYDVELKSFYQNPTNCVWMFDPTKGIWSPGPSLPRTSLETVDVTISFRGFAFGQAVSHAGYIYYSGGATLAINNVYKTCDTAPLHKYEYVSLPKVLRLEPNLSEWKTTFTSGHQHKQDYTLYGAVPTYVNLKRIKVKNGRLVSCHLAQETSPTDYY